MQRNPIFIAVSRASSLAIISQRMACRCFQYLLIYLNYTPKYRVDQLQHQSKCFMLIGRTFSLFQLMASLFSNCADYNNEVFHRRRIIFRRNYFVIYCH